MKLEKVYGWPGNGRTKASRVLPKKFHTPHYLPYIFLEIWLTQKSSSVTRSLAEETLKASRPSNKKCLSTFPPESAWTRKTPICYRQDNWRVTTGCSLQLSMSKIIITLYPFLIFCKIGCSFIFSTLSFIFSLICKSHHLAYCKQNLKLEKSDRFQRNI